MGRHYSRAFGGQHRHWRHCRDRGSGRGPRCVVRRCIAAWDDRDSPHFGGSPRGGYAGADRVASAARFPTAPTWQPLGEPATPKATTYAGVAVIQCSLGSLAKTEKNTYCLASDLNTLKEALDRRERKDVQSLDSDLQHALAQARGEQFIAVAGVAPRTPLAGWFPSTAASRGGARWVSHRVRTSSSRPRSPSPILATPRE